MMNLDTGNRTTSPLRVIVLTSPGTEHEMADALAKMPCVDLAGVFTAPLPRPRGWRRRIRNVLRYHGVVGAGRLIGSRLLTRLRAMGGDRSGVLPARPYPMRILRSFHDEEGLQALRAAAPDIIALDGTYILPPPVFSIARIATLNLHCGKLPDYRGAPPVFWELYNGEREVGVTIHGVTADVDGGPIYEQALFPLPNVVRTDPVRFAIETWKTVLRPAGLALMARTIDEIARGEAHPRPQGPAHPVYRRPDIRAIRRMRRLMRQRSESR